MLSGAGVGGGSLGYANTLYRAPRAFYEDPQWRDLTRTGSAALAPHYDEAERMLGVVDVVTDDPADELLRAFGEHVGVAASYAKTRVGVYFGDGPGVTAPDPFFGGEGPSATGCRSCGALHGGLPARREEHAGQELPLPRRGRGRDDPRRTPRSSTSGRSARRTARTATRSTVQRTGRWLRRRRRTLTAARRRPRGRARSGPTGCSRAASSTARSRGCRTASASSSARTPRRSSR